MQVKVLEEHGLDSALRGMSYSFRIRDNDVEAWWESKKERAYQRAATLAHKDGGHNKFLEAIQVWIDLDCSRAMWSQLDTYRSGITKQSDSTMHTLAKRTPLDSDFEQDTDPRSIALFKQLWEENKQDITVLKNALPEGFLQRRVICTNYKAIRNIVAQRNGHRYKWWDVFINELLEQLEHPEFIVEGYTKQG